MVFGSPRMCMATQPTPAWAATEARVPDMSLMRVAPASTAARATAGFTVSIDTRTRGARAATTGTTRRSSSSWGTGSAPGRLDSPPTSTTSAPSSAISSPRATAASASNHSPPSENESGVTFSTPMTRGRMRARVPVATGRSVTVDELDRLGPGGRIGTKEPPDLGRHRDGAGLAHPPHGHAEVLGLDDDEHAPGLEPFDEGVGDLGGQPLLDLGPAGEPLDQPGQLGQPGDAAVVVRDVGDVGLADERHQVVLAHAVEGDVADHDH